MTAVPSRDIEGFLPIHRREFEEEISWGSTKQEYTSFLLSS